MWGHVDDRPGRAAHEARPPGPERSPAPLLAVLTLRGADHDVAHARHCVARTLHGLPADLVDTAVLLTSELVTNAIVHGCRRTDRPPAVTVAVLAPAGRVRVEVGDTGPSADLAPRAVTASSEGGRGLLLLDVLAADWAHHRLPDGLLVWFELETGRPGRPPA